MLINTVKRRIGAREAASKLKGFWRELKHGRFVGTVEFYVPYRCFDVTIKNGRATDRILIAIDSVCGRLDPWRIDRQTLTEDCSLIETPNMAEERLSEALAVKVLDELTRRATYMKGFFKLRDVGIDARFIETIYIPYWVGIYERNDQASLDAINGITGVREGPKLREVVTDWLKPPSGVVAA
jgi:hypothetical protein